MAIPSFSQIASWIAFAAEEQRRSRAPDATAHIRQVEKLTHTQSGPSPSFPTRQISDFSAPRSLSNVYFAAGACYGFPSELRLSSAPRKDIETHRNKFVERLLWIIFRHIVFGFVRGGG